MKVLGEELEWREAAFFVGVFGVAGFLVWQPESFGEWLLGTAFMVGACAVLPLLVIVPYLVVYLVLGTLFEWMDHVFRKVGGGGSGTRIGDG